MMGLTLALTRDEVLRQMGHYVGGPSDSGSSILIIMLAAAVMIGTAYYVWNWQARVSRDVGSGALLGQMGTSIGLNLRQRRLLKKMGRAANLEPSVALISPQLLTELIRRSEMGGMKLSNRQMTLMGRISEIVAASCNKSAEPPAQAA